MNKDRPKTGVYRKGGGRSYGNDYGSGNYGSDRERPKMYHAICANCGNKCEVPFNPTGERPVYCRDCFNKQDNDFAPRGGGNSYERRGGSRDGGSSNSGALEGIEKRLKRIEEKLDELLASV